MTAAGFHLAALACIAAGALCLYLGTPRQLWLARPLPARPVRAGGGVLMLAGWLTWCAVLHPAAAFFTALTAAMVAFVAIPTLAAVTAPHRKG